MDITKIIQKKRVSFHTLGCRLNFAESGSLAQGFADRGYEIVPFGETADLVMINTCTVTDQADSTCRNLIRRAHKASPEAKIVVVGCYAQMEPQKIAGIQGVDLVLGNSEKYKVFDYLDEEDQQIVKVDKDFEFWGAATTSADSHTRAFLKIQDGCNYICSYCIIPQARGRSRAMQPDEAVTFAQKVIGQGFKEIVLTGVNIGEYAEASGTAFSELVARLLEVKGLERLRLSSVEPNTITEDLLKIMKNSPKAMDHFHLPLQSGDDQILQSMRRKYSVDEYRRIVAMVKDYFPNAGIGADIILGYPGESDEQFQRTYQLLRDLPITHVHAFPFSKRNKTLAARMDNHIPHQTKKYRVRAVLMFGEAKQQEFMQSQIGRATTVLFEEKNAQGEWEGLTTNYLRCAVRSDADLKNQILPVHLTNIDESKLHGEIIH
ncbi:MAG: tRNA (N(6)-L-threonylcarbamoyladenosine(37)-C(2))-methylthiotransferase MtaB [Bdellovibrio sp.]|nr:tRNA (N(6)-L-threonylcarbamoyladenosine(37)-C(2))-methylthiotransferase MtaB [Bdellovibrio sp.]